MEYSKGKISFFIFMGFFLIVPIGTISHELGHYLPAKYLGHSPTLHYNLVSTETTSKEKKLIEIVENNKHQLDNDIRFKDENLHSKLYNELRSENRKILLGGMISTYAIGTLGLLLILYRRYRFKHKIGITDYIGLFLSLFWLRPVFNLFYSLFNYLTGMSSYPFLGDELRASMSFNLKLGTFSILFCIIGIIVSSITTILTIPKQFFIQFLLFGTLGSISGYLMWYVIIGKIFLP